MANTVIMRSVLTWASEEHAMSTTPRKVAYAAQILLQDEEGLLESFSDEVGEGTVQSALMHYLTQVDKQPVEAGYEVLRRSLDRESTDTFTLKVTALIKDEAKFKAEYQECAEACFGSAGDMADQSPSEMLAWIMTVANKSDSPSNLGYAIVKVMDAQPHVSRKHANEELAP